MALEIYRVILHNIARDHVRLACGHVEFTRSRIRPRAFGKREEREPRKRMSSMRLYGKLVASENGELAGTHCVVQWEEEGDPRSVVEKKRMIDFSVIGETCKVRVTEKAKTVVYPTSWLRVVSHSILIYRYRIPLFYTTGSKSEMEKILNTFEGDDDVPVGSKAKKSVSRRPKQTSANQKSKVCFKIYRFICPCLTCLICKGAVKAFQKKKAQEEADRVTKLLLAGLQDVTEAAPTATTNLHLSPSPGSKQSDHQVMYIYSTKQWQCVYTVSLTFPEVSTAQSG